MRISTLSIFKEFSCSVSFYLPVRNGNLSAIACFGVESALFNYVLQNCMFGFLFNEFT